VLIGQRRQLETYFASVRQCPAVQWSSTFHFTAAGILSRYKFSVHFQEEEAFDLPDIYARAFALRIINSLSYSVWQFWRRFFHSYSI